MRDIDKRLTCIINEMDNVIRDLSCMVVDSMLHMHNQDCEIEDLKLQLDAADQDYHEFIAERNSLSETCEALTKEVNRRDERFAELRKIIKENVILPDSGVIMNFDSTIEPDKFSRFLELLELEEEDLYD